MPADDALIARQIDYYRARASEYDEWFLRIGRYDRGAEHTAAWFAEIRALEEALDRFAPEGRVLELACGTGWWTERLARHAEHVHAVDASPEVVALNRRRLEGTGLGERVSFEIADLFAWRPPSTFDAVFFSFWLSHVPGVRFAPFWATVRAAGGRAFLIDSLRDAGSTALDQRLEGTGEVTRRLNDGREFRIVKVFWDRDDLTARLDALGLDAALSTTGRFFLYGSVTAR